MFNLKKEKLKKNIFLTIQIVFAALTIIGAFLVFTEKVDNAGFAVIPMLFSLVFGTLYRNSKVTIEENTKR